jgi:hypothetical protein
MYGIAVKAQAPTATERQVKAVFLFNFTQFTAWPDDAFSTSETPFVIGIIGEDPFGKYLDDVVAGEKANGHTLIVKRFKSVEDAKNCQLLFVNISDPEKLKLLMGELKGRSILTVSDHSDFLKSGGMVRFFTKDNKIQFQINPDTVKTENLSMSSKLLRLATIYKPGKN